MPQDLEIGLRLVAAALLGGVIGLERERQGKEAGVRTYALVCLGSALFMIVSVQIYEMYKIETRAIVDPSRIAAQVVTGIGFLGAGAIIRFPQKIKGLTTAAGIWTASGIGLATGLGLYKPAIFTTIIALVVLTVFSHIDRYFGGTDQ
ncbi:MAG: MgtC/SapB family protein [Candidatus Omnitrophica bacterium]|nr:MgtC/SapB family protein [Candidatus Omnitrophota bacterium]